MNKQTLTFLFALLMLSCGGKENETNTEDISRSTDTIGFYQKTKNKVTKLFEKDEQQELFIKKDEKLSKKYEEYNAVNKWFKASKLEIFEKEKDEITDNFFKIVKAETTYKNETSIAYFTTPDAGIRYCYLNDDYIYFLEFEYDGSNVNNPIIERLSRGLRFENFEKLTFNNQGRIESKSKSDDYRYTISKNEDGFSEITYKNMLWEIKGDKQLLTTLTLDAPKYAPNWKESKWFNNVVVEIILWLMFIIFIIFIIGMFSGK